MALRKEEVKFEDGIGIVNYCTLNNNNEKWKNNIQKFNNLEKLYQELIINIGIEIDNIINTHAISEDELIKISKVVAEYVTCTRLTDFKKILFDGDKPRLLSDFMKK